MICISEVSSVAFVDLIVQYSATPTAVEDADY